MAHKKGAGSTKNGRDSNAKRLGVKRFGGEQVRAGNIFGRRDHANLFCAFLTKCVPVCAPPHILGDDGETKVRGAASCRWASGRLPGYVAATRSP